MVCRLNRRLLFKRGFVFYLPRPLTRRFERTCDVGIEDYCAGYDDVTVHARAEIKIDPGAPERCASRLMIVETRLLSKKRTTMARNLATRRRALVSSYNVLSHPTKQTHESTFVSSNKSTKFCSNEPACCCLAPLPRFTQAQRAALAPQVSRVLWHSSDAKSLAPRRSSLEPP